MDDRLFRFPREERLHKRKGYLEIYKEGEKIHCPLFVLYVSPNQLTHHRLGITVSRKVGNAVVRNRIKRLVRETYRRNRGEISPSCDLVVNVKRAAAGASYDDFNEHFRQAFGRWLLRRLRK